MPSLRPALRRLASFLLLVLIGLIRLAHAAPTVSLSAPAAGATYLAPASLTVSATASAGTTLTQVEFLDGATVLATLTASPYTFTWNNVPAGSHPLTARATDSAGGVTTSAARTITVNGGNTPPTVSLTAPADGTVHTLPASVTVSATASGVEVNTPITRVDFYQGVTLIGSTTTAPYATVWTPATAGSYRLTARATDSGGATTTSAARTITVQAINQAPTVSLTVPANGASYVAPAAITLTASAADTDGTISKVEFFQGTTLIGTATAAPYTVTWNSVPAGSYSLTAQAIDHQGAATTSAAWTITVNATNTPPTVSLTAPADGAVYSLPATVPVSATADGVAVDTPITRVDFYQGATLIGGGTDRPNTLSWTPTTAGSYRLTAQATDSAGGVTTSAARTVTVQAGNQAPTVSLTAPAAGASFVAPAAIPLTATAADTDGTISKVEFFQGTTLIGTATAAPYTVTWNSVPAGSYSLTAQATDHQGAATTSVARTITVTASGPTVLYLHGDHLGTPRVATNEANVVVWRNLPTGEPFGMALPEEDPDGDGKATTINLRFPGQYFDRETKLHYNYFRGNYSGGGSRRSSASKLKRGEAEGAVPGKSGAGRGRDWRPACAGWRDTSE